MTDSDRATDPDLHLLANGQRFDPKWDGGRACFNLPVPVSGVRLRSLASQPRALGPNGDSRLLGYRVTSIAIVHAGSDRRFVPADLRLLEGCYDDPDEGCWTNGDAHLPDAWFAGTFGPLLVRIEGSPLPAYARASDAAARDAQLFAGFENLGENCDFGIAQSLFNAHPVGLLRWGLTTIPHVVAGLRCGFRGIGDDPYTSLVWDPEEKEYKLGDVRYLSVHTWARDEIKDPVALAEMKHAGRARLRLLARKLMADLRSGRRICVVTQRVSRLDMDQVRQLHAALRAIGPNALLAVDRASAPADLGRVDYLGDGLYVGHIDRFARDAGATEIWHRLCTTTRRMVDEGTTAVTRPSRSSPNGQGP
jgi:hypothetical protein